MKSLEELREKDNEELIEILRDLEEELFRIRRTIMSGGQVEKPGRVKFLKKQKARILTILRERGVKV